MLWGQRALTSEGLIVRSWDELTGRTSVPASSPATPPPAAPSSLQWTSHDEAEELCFTAYSTAIIASVTGSVAQRELRSSEAEAINYLCEKALTKDGPKGVHCFLEAWDASKGMERVFQGSGMRVYDEIYSSCLGRR